MAETIPRHILIGMILFTIIVMGGVSFIGSFRSEYTDYGNDNLNKFGDFNKTFSKMDEITARSNALETAIDTGTDDEGINAGVFGMLNTLITSAWNGLRGLFGSLEFIKDMFVASPDIFPWIPYFIPTLFGSIITIILVFAIWSAIFQKDV